MTDKEFAAYLTSMTFSEAMSLEEFLDLLKQIEKTPGVLKTGEQIQEELAAKCNLGPEQKRTQ